MVTLVLSLGRVTGADLGLVLWLACAAAYLGLCFRFRANRGRRGRRAVFIALLLAAAAFDLLLYVCCCDRGQYVSRGIGAAYGFLLWAPALLFTAALVTAFNKRRG